jgi:glutamine cyclotransferase
LKSHQRTKKKTSCITISLLLVVVALTAGCLQEQAPPAAQGPQVYGYKVLNTYPHDPQAFTEGLIFHNGTLYESTGLYGQSSLRQVDLETGRVLQERRLSPQYFAEGLTTWNGQFLQLTWKSHLGLVWNLDNFTVVGTFAYPSEGWGITHDGQSLIMSDGTSILYFLDPQTFQEVRQIEVQDRGDPVALLNELEYINGEIYANVWKTDRIARISPETGQVVGWIDLSGLRDVEPPDVELRDVEPELLDGEPELLDVDEKARSEEAVLNGIAYDSAGHRLFVTGKLWPRLFEIQLVAKD